MIELLLLVIVNQSQIARVSIQRPFSCQNMLIIYNFIAVWRLYLTIPYVCTIVGVSNMSKNWLATQDKRPKFCLIWVIICIIAQIVHLILSVSIIVLVS